MSVGAHVRTGKRRVSIARDGDDYIVKDQRLGVMLRGHDINELRRACHWLQWDLEDAEALFRPSNALKQPS